jgi:hypothetical protein
MPPPSNAVGSPPRLPTFKRPIPSYVKQAFLGRFMLISNGGGIVDEVEILDRSDPRIVALLKINSN